MEVQWGIVFAALGAALAAGLAGAFIFIDAVPSSFSETVTVPVYVPSAV